jgi:hypothetical protein
MQLPLRGVNDRLLPHPLGVAGASAGKAEEQEAGQTGEGGQNDRSQVRIGYDAGRRNDGPGMTSKLAVAVGLAISGVAHLAFLTPAVIFGGGPFDSPPASAITVDIVSPEEVPQPTGEPPPETPPKESPAKEPPKAADASVKPPPAAPAATPSQRAPSATPQAAAISPSVLPPPPLMAPQLPEPPHPPEPEESNAPAMFAMPMTMPDGTVGGRTFDRQAVDQPDVTRDIADAFFDRVKTCAKRPADVPQGVRVVLRVYLNPDGTLATGLPDNPAPLKVSMGGGELFTNAVAALRQCQPYTMLPPDRYPEWRMLDLTFTPQNF